MHLILLSLLPISYWSRPSRVQQTFHQLGTEAVRLTVTDRLAELTGYPIGSELNGIFILSDRPMSTTWYIYLTIYSSHFPLAYERICFFGIRSWCKLQIIKPLNRVILSTSSNMTIWFCSYRSL